MYIGIKKNLPNFLYLRFLQGWPIYSILQCSTLQCYRVRRLDHSFTLWSNAQEMSTTLSLLGPIMSCFWIQQGSPGMSQNVRITYPVLHKLLVGQERPPQPNINCITGSSGWPVGGHSAIGCPLGGFPLIRINSVCHQSVSKRSVDCELRAFGVIRSQDNCQMPTIHYTIRLF